MNKNLIKDLIIFLGGAGLGSLTTWLVTRKYYADLAQEGIDSYKDVVNENLGVVTEELDTPSEKALFDAEKPDIDEFMNNYLNNHIFHNDNMINYSAFSDDSKNETEGDDQESEVKETVEKPYVIPPEEFGEFEDYEKIELTYYSDKTLADENLDIVEDLDETIGDDSLTHFGEYEADSVFVRNDKRKCDYQILLDEDSYQDALKSRPYLVNDV